MRYPQLAELNTSRDMIEAFGGYNHNPRIRDGEFYDMKNLTSANYPVLSPRPKRGTYATPESPQGLIAKDALCYVDGRYFVMNEYRVDMGLSTDEEDCPKTLVSMGAYVIILPDKMYINTLDLTDFGNIEATFEATALTTFTLSTMDGTAYEDTTISDTEPSNPENLAYWIDTSSTPHTLKQYSTASAMWVQIPTTYVKISSVGIGKAFELYDGVTISGIVNESLQDLNNTMPIWSKGDDYIVVVGMIDTTIEQTVEEGAIKVARKMPLMDFVTESGNRLWGCRYGVAANGEVVNELYACKLGDFKNWHCYMGISTDSYAVTLGSDGIFTGAITHLGFPLFFKEGFLHKVYGTSPSSFQVQDTACRGVQRGCERSLAIVNEILYYKARHAVCAYDGSLPVEVSEALGDIRYGNAVAAAHGNKYYVSMQSPDGLYHLFVYDTSRGMWHKEDYFHAEALCSCEEALYGIDSSTKHIVALAGSQSPTEGDVEWMAESGDLYLSYPDMKYISKLTVRLSMEIGASVAFYIQYDMSDRWEHICTIRGTRLGSFTAPIRPLRCDHMKIRIVGKGKASIYSIAKTIETGSDVI